MTTAIVIEGSETEPETPNEPTPEETAAAAIEAGMQLQQRATEEANRQAQETANREASELRTELASLGQRLTTSLEAINERLTSLEAEELEPEELSPESGATIDGAEIVEIVPASPEPEPTPAPKQAPGGIRKALARVFLNK